MIAQHEREVLTLFIVSLFLLELLESYGYVLQFSNHNLYFLN